MKNLFLKYTLLFFWGGNIFFNSSCAQTAKVTTNKETIKKVENTAQLTQPNPASDPMNKGGWVLNKEISDEFEGKELDTDKWFVEGQDGDLSLIHI